MGKTRLKSDDEGKDFLFSRLTPNQTTNIGGGDHLKFDDVDESRGTKITLDTTTPYTNTANVASLGRFTLKGGSTYKLTAIMRAVFPAAGGSALEFKDSDSGTSIQPIVSIPGPSNSGNETVGNTIVTIFAPSVDTRIELEIQSGGNPNSFTSGKNLVIIEEI